jgi:hypothetical protein
MPSRNIGSALRSRREDRRAGRGSLIEDAEPFAFGVKGDEPPPDRDDRSNALAAGLELLLLDGGVHSAWSHSD